MTELFWRNAKEELPDETGWYLVYAPSYRGGSSGGREYFDGLMFSKYNIAKNGNKSWSIEYCRWNKGVVKFWMPCPDKPVIDDQEETQEQNDIPGQLKFDF